MITPVELAGPGGNYHRAGCHVACQVLVDNGWSILPTNDRWRHDGTGLLPDIIAEKWDNKVRRKITMIVECETARRAKLMAERERYYTDTFPQRAQRFVVVPLWQLKGAKRDSLKAIREVVGGVLP